MPFISVGETIKKGLQQKITGGIILSLKAEKTLDQALPHLLPELTEKVQFHSFRDGRLSLTSSSPTVSQEVFLQRDKIKRRLNEELEGNAVKKIGFKIADR
jgi:hypothetical protein